MNIPHSVHKIVPFEGSLIPEPTLTSDSVICFGSYSMRHTAKARGWYPGVFDLEEVTFPVQCAHWGDHMLNADAIVTTIDEARFTEESMFIRPIEDSKSFSGHVETREEFDDWRRKIVAFGEDYGLTIRGSDKIQLCRLKRIYAEYRFWVVKGVIVTASLYKRGNTIVYERLPNDTVHHAFVNARISEFQPHEAFVIDVCDTDDGIKIVEINTINAAGFYAADTVKLCIALEEAYATPQP